MNLIEIKVPDIGDFKSVEVVELLVRAGERIAADQSLITVESDKASMEIPSSHAGVITEMRIAVGDKVAEGSLMLLLDAAEQTGQAAPPSPAAAPAAPAAAAAAQASLAIAAAVSAAAVLAKPAAAAPAAPPRSAAPSPAHASPSMRKYARELGVDLALVTGSGPRNRILRTDINSHIKQALAGGPKPPAGNAGLALLPWPSLDFSAFGDTELVPLSRIKKISGPNLHRNWVMIPHVTQWEDADITDLEQFRVAANQGAAKSAAKITMLALAIKASVAALKKYPAFNSSLDATGENLIVKRYYHIGFAADTPNGLMVPVIRDADRKGVAQIAQEMAELSAAAREGKLKPSDMGGASFTISSLGGIGSTAFTPIINAPEVAILGLSKAQTRPVWDREQFVPRLIMPLSLSYDHRVIDGAMGARFSGTLAALLGDMRKILL